jgi:uncharacterized membrane protein YbaN (DUF454 family)
MKRALYATIGFCSLIAGVVQVLLNPPPPWATGIIFILLGYTFDRLSEREKG